MLNLRNYQSCMFGRVQKYYVYFNNFLRTASSRFDAIRTAVCINGILVYFPCLQAYVNRFLTIFISESLLKSALTISNVFISFLSPLSTAFFNLVNKSERLILGTRCKAFSSSFLVIFEYPLIPLSFACFLSSATVAINGYCNIFFTV